MSAVTGETAFLDLPAIAPVFGTALSDDGTKLAYWMTAGKAGESTRRTPVA